MQINDMKEYNCLLRYGVQEGISGWFWTDGNDMANSGVWTHAYDNSDVSFYPPKISCGCSDSKPYCSARGEAFFMYIAGTGDKQAHGVYCDDPSTSTRNFICEGTI